LFVLSDKDNVRKRGRRGKHQQEEADQDQAKILKVLLLSYCLKITVALIFMDCIMRLFF
jgi:hypothetical protein